MKYRVKTGLNWGRGEDERRAEPGEVRDDIPAKSVPWLLAQGLIEEIPEAPKGGDR
jgi:hypothetical protein